VREAPGCLLQGTNEIQTPYDKRPSDRYCLQGLSGQVRLSRVELTPSAGPYNSSGIGHRGRPVENFVGKRFPRGPEVLHGDRKPLSVFLVTTLVLGRRICIIGECLRGWDSTTLFHHPVKRMTWRAEPVTELRPCRGAALLGGDILGSGSASSGLA
jgi:hypothetical protein